MKRLNQHAFTLVELLTVLMIVSVIVMIAYPMLQNLFYVMEARKVEHTFVDMMRTARAKSYISKKDVVLCLVDETGRCDRTGSAGIIVFHDNNHDNHFLDGIDVLLAQEHWRIKRGSLLLRSSASRHYIRYKGDTSKPRGHMGHLQYCSDSPNNQLKFKIIYSMYGHLRAERQALVDIGC